MKYKAKVLKTNYNVSHQHPLREFIILITGAALILFALFWFFGRVVDFTVDNISADTEQRLHQVFGSSLTNQFEGEEMEDRRSAQAQLLLADLSACTQLRYPVTLHVTQSDDINAVALPGGHILLFSGLIDKLHSENGLAFVLAHELAHFTNKDHLRLMGRSVVMATVSILIGADNSNFINFMSPVNQLEQAQFSQHRESTADKIALDILQCHYGHVGGADEFFKHLVNNPLFFDSGLNHYFSTHPEALLRIEQLQQLVIDKGYSLGRTIAL